MGLATGKLWFPMAYWRTSQVGDLLLKSQSKQQEMCSFNALYLPLSLSSPPPRSGCFWKETFPPAVTHTASSHSPLLFSTFSVREVDAVASESPACCSVVLGGRTDSLNSSSVSKLVSPMLQCCAWFSITLAGLPPFLCLP